ncbi:MAG: hypothetical protein CM1200mP12_10630 [Gammaproteobacteria bacterium]|nr:MAG: hypothetical protein CM1200mP12_10630 [Gammaproteobacteria bacterium]
MGLDYESIIKINPNIIYTSISGYGQSGPYINRRVYDPLIQATAGAAASQMPIILSITKQLSLTK